jgi:hypothetical protein
MQHYRLGSPELSLHDVRSKTHPLRWTGGDGRTQPKLLALLQTIRGPLTEGGATEPGHGRVETGQDREDGGLDVTTSW